MRATPLVLTGWPPHHGAMPASKPGARHPALGSALVQPEAQIYGGAALAAIAALVIATADGDVLQLTLGMLLVAISVLLTIIGGFRLRRQESLRRADSSHASDRGTWSP